MKEGLKLSPSKAGAVLLLGSRWFFAFGFSLVFCMFDQRACGCTVVDIILQVNLRNLSCSGVCSSHFESVKEMRRNLAT